jgi:hypothetical protein
MRILAHKNNWQKSPISAIPVVVAFAQAATRRTRAMAKRTPIMIQFIVRSGLSISTCISGAAKFHIVQ